MSFKQGIEVKICVAGVDLAWGERRPDGVCVIQADRRRARVAAVGLPRCDDELLAFLDQHIGNAPALIAVDAPIVCPNLSAISIVVVVVVMTAVPGAQEVLVNVLANLPPQALTRFGLEAEVDASHAGAMVPGPTCSSRSPADSNLRTCRRDCA